MYKHSNSKFHVQNLYNCTALQYSAYLQTCRGGVEVQSKEFYQTEQLHGSLILYFNVELHEQQNCCNLQQNLISTHVENVYTYRVYKKKRNLGISQEIDIVLKTKDFRRLGI